MKWMITLMLTAALVSVMVTACSGDLILDDTVKDANFHTIEANQAIYELLDFNDRQEFEFATRGLLAAPEQLEISDENGKVVWSLKAFDFVVDTNAPGEANPSLWRHTQLNHIYGLFEVTDGIYQVRGYDMSSLTLIAGETGWIIFDPLISEECSRAALKLANDTLGERPVVGVVYSHPHVDHFGGVRGVISDEDIHRGVPIIAPYGFEQYAVSENVYVGTAMERRAGYQYGVLLDPSDHGRLAMGIGMGQSTGTISYVSPTDLITYTGEVRVIDGVEMVFQMTPGTEAPAEMNIWFPAYNALWMAENCTGTLHNLYTLRGAQVRDGNAWSEYIMEAVTLYGGEAEVLFQSHNWPRWGNNHINEYMVNTAAMYKFIHDQTLLYINQGYTSSEIAHMIRLPKDLERVWYTRQYYGTVAHNARAVYQKYMGWYDGNPVNLHPLPPSESARKFAEYMGDNRDKILEMAKRDFDNGEYQWVAQITNILVFANPMDAEARYLCADALEQLAYQSESGPWRNVYLSGALELRHGMSKNDENTPTDNGDLFRALTPSMVLDVMGIRLNSNAAQDVNMTINLNVAGDDTYLITVRAGVLLYQKGASVRNADVTISLPHSAMYLLLLPGGLDNEHVRIDGNRRALNTLYGYFTEYNPDFNIIEP